MKNLLIIALAATMVACGGGGGGSSAEPHTPTMVDDIKPAPVTTCEEWEDNGDGTESRFCKETVSGEVVKKWTETREVVGVNEATDQKVVNESGYKTFSEQYYLNVEIVEEDGILVIKEKN